MQTFQESALTFGFPEPWLVRRFDGTVAYQSLSGRGLKGVDFIALDERGDLWLIEVKNYRPRISTQNGREYRANRQPPDALAAAIHRKFTDSERLIRITTTYIRRHWWRRLQLWWQRQRRNAASNYRFWALADAALAAGRTHYVLWLETPERRTDYDTAIERRLREQMPGHRVEVAEATRRHTLPFGVVPREDEGPGV